MDRTPEARAGPAPTPDCRRGRNPGRGIHVFKGLRAIFRARVSANRLAARLAARPLQRPSGGPPPPIRYRTMGEERRWRVSSPARQRGGVGPCGPGLDRGVGGGGARRKLDSLAVTGARDARAARDRLVGPRCEPRRKRRVRQACPNRTDSPDRLSEGPRSRARNPCFQGVASNIPGDRDARAAGGRCLGPRCEHRRRRRVRRACPNRTDSPDRLSEGPQSRARNPCFQGVAREFPGDRSARAPRDRRLGPRSEPRLRRRVR